MRVRLVCQGEETRTTQSEIVNNRGNARVRCTGTESTRANWEERYSDRCGEDNPRERYRGYRLETPGLSLRTADRKRVA